MPPQRRRRNNGQRQGQRQGQGQGQGRYASDVLGLGLGVGAGKGQGGQRGDPERRGDRIDGCTYVYKIGNITDPETRLRLYKDAYTWYRTFVSLIPPEHLQRLEITPGWNNLPPDVVAAFTYIKQISARAKNEALNALRSHITNLESEVLRAKQQGFFKDVNGTLEYMSDPQPSELMYLFNENQLYYGQDPVTDIVMLSSGKLRKVAADVLARWNQRKSGAAGVLNSFWFRRLVYDLATDMFVAFYPVDTGVREEALPVWFAIRNGIVVPDEMRSDKLPTKPLDIMSQTDTEMMALAEKLGIEGEIPSSPAKYWSSASMSSTAPVTRGGGKASASAPTPTPAPRPTRARKPPAASDKPRPPRKSSAASGKTTAAATKAKRAAGSRPPCA